MNDQQESQGYAWEAHFKEGKPVGRQRQKVIEAFLPLVRSVASRIKSRVPAFVAFDDLVSVGTLGLIAAVDRYDPARKGNFPKYASIRIQGAILDELRQADWASRSVRHEVREVNEKRKNLENRLGRKASQAEMADNLGMDVGRYAGLIRRLAPKNVIRFEDMGIRNDSDKRSALNFLADPNSPDPSEESVLKDAYEMMVEAIDDLKDRQRQVISLYYFEELKIQEIAAIFEVTEGRISQIHTAAIQALKKKIRNRM